jgi:hypothetical protein
MKCPNCSHHFHYRQAVVVEHQGTPMSLREVSTATGIAYSTLQNRYRRGDRGEQLVRPADEKYSPHRRAVA